MYLGIDLGTSELKALLLDPEQRVVAVSRASIAVSRPRPLWSEQEPAGWWRALEGALGELRERTPQAMRAVRAIGLSGQMHGAVLLDAAGAVLRPAILWNDGRSGDACAALTRAVPRLAEITGNLAMPGFTAPKLVWLREHEPEVFARTARVLLPKDWLRFMLTGEAVSDCSDASGTLWLDVARRRWSPVMLDACGLTEAHMPRLVEGSEPSARVGGAVAARLGLGDDVLVAGGAGDNAASAVGIGAVEPGQGFVSLGTSGVVFQVTARFEPNPAQAVHAFCHALPERWHQMSVMLSAASSVQWAARTLGFADEAALLAAAETLPAAERAGAPCFLPYLSGERTPHNDPELQAAFVGLTHAHGAAALAYAVVEGVSFGLRDGFDALSPAGGAGASPLSLVGGGSRSAFWAQLLASVLGRSLVTHAGGEAGAALGAARLGWLAAGGAERDICLRPPPARRFDPAPDEGALLDERRARFVASIGAAR